MAKGVKKKNRKLRRQIRRTFGALLMISAIVVATLPVQDVSANPVDNGTVPIKVAVVDSQQATGSSPFASAASQYPSNIPHACERSASPEEQIVYTSGDGTFQFVYMRPKESDRNKVAVVLGYNSGVLMDSTLVIPETLEAYNKYTDNATNQGYCLVSKNNEFLHYASEVQKTNGEKRKMFTVPSYIDPLTGTNPEVADNQLVLVDGVQKYPVNTTEVIEGVDVTTTTYYDVEPIMVTKTDNPCYYEQINEWKDIPNAELYYKDATDTMVQAGTDDNHWKIEANVAYIGSEKIRDNGVTGWELDGDITSPTEGIFANQKNITTLIIGSNVLGIGDYAFYGCSTLQSVSLANGLNTIGNGAFAECINMKECALADNANIQAIGKDAFFNCRSLTSFTVPIGLEALGDCCFENCSKLQEINFTGNGNEVALRELGDHLFKGCSSLAAVEFPDTYLDINPSGTQQEIDISMFEGCTSLQYVKIPNADLQFKDAGELPWDSTRDAEGNITILGFKDTVPESFYFEGPATSNIHDTATAKSIAFKYLGQDLYEKIMYERDAVKDSSAPPDQKSAKVTYQVNSLNELVKFFINSGDKPENVTIPEAIGPYFISAIGAGSFNDNCDLTKITIPSSVVSIGDNAFKGCHNLETVIFTDASAIQDIGTDAFKTQEISCGDTLKEDNKATPENEGPKLVFVGAMMNDVGADTVPFMYAMNGVSNINNANQEKIWITCHSGWPTNLEVQYKFDPITNSGLSQLVGYPRYELIDNPAEVEDWVSKLPYVTDENKAQYIKMVENATAYYKASEADKQTMQQPTENEMAIISSTLHVVVPTSVDCIKPGLFSGYTANAEGDNPDVVSGILPDTKIESIVLNGVDEIEPFTFTGCTALNEVAIIGASKVDDYAFGCEETLGADGKINQDKGCEALTKVALGPNIIDMGKRPFRGCSNLTDVECLDTNFAYQDGLLFDQTTGNKTLVQCLPGRGSAIGSYTVSAGELAGVTGLQDEAFMDCNEIGKVDLSDSVIEEIPMVCFNNCDQLNSVILPDTAASIEADAFVDNPLLRVVTIPASVSYIEKDAFISKPTQQKITFQCVDGSAADRYAKQSANKGYIIPEYGVVTVKHNVYFWDYTDYPDLTTKALYDKQKVTDGTSAVAPSPDPSHAGYTFTGWTDYSNITRDTDIYATYSDEAFKVTFFNWDGVQIAQEGFTNPQFVERGKSAAKPPIDPVREGYTFTGWTPDYNNIQQELTIIAQFKNNADDDAKHTVIFYAYKDGKLQAISTQYIEDGKAATEPATPPRSGYTFSGWAPSDFTNVTADMTIVASYEKGDGSGDGGGGGGGGSASAKPTSSSGKSSKSSATPTPTPTPSVKKYTVSVSGGSGSGSYEAGAVVAINAYDMGVGKNFEKWTSSTAGVGFANSEAASTTFTMPANNVAITATYKAGGATGNSATGGSNTNTSGANNSGTNGTGNAGTQVQVNRPGISNTNLAGATVSGSTDNFIVKVTEDQAATDAAVAALQARYGDISRIKFAAMDISLYDSTGRTKIADTSNMSVNLTLPIPDDLAQYAGNNKVAAISNGALEDLNTRMATVENVACINFTAPHFSPYVIYVDTANLVQGTVDATPQTGDPIHPKWFLAMGMACVAMILFFKRDKVVVNTKTA